MAASTSTQTGDRPGYATFSDIIQQERSLLDEKALLENELKWLGQILSRLVLNSASPTTDPQVLGVVKLSAERKKSHGDIVSIYGYNGQTIH